MRGPEGGGCGEPGGRPCPKWRNGLRLAVLLQASLPLWSLTPDHGARGNEQKPAQACEPALTGGASGWVASAWWVFSCFPQSCCLGVTRPAPAPSSRCSRPIQECHQQNKHPAPHQRPLPSPTLPLAFVSYQVHSEAQTELSVRKAGQKLHCLTHMAWGVEDTQVPSIPITPRHLWEP